MEKQLYLQKILLFHSQAHSYKNYDEALTTINAINPIRVLSILSDVFPTFDAEMKSDDAVALLLKESFDNVLWVRQLSTFERERYIQSITTGQKSIMLA